MPRSLPAGGQRAANTLQSLHLALEESEGPLAQHHRLSKHVATRQGHTSYLPGLTGSACMAACPPEPDHQLLRHVSSHINALHEHFVSLCRPPLQHNAPKHSQQD